MLNLYVYISHLQCQSASRHSIKFNTYVGYKWQEHVNVLM